jgi:hypothetical protein
MPKLTPEGEKIVAALAERYALSMDAVKIMLDAVARGGGIMAQFNLPEFGGSGQWMRGGMTMVGDMFNNSLKATVDNLCSELSNLLASQPNIFAPVNQSQSQSQGSGGGWGEGVSIYQTQSHQWWPSELGNPASTGAQNAMRYAYFPDRGRLAIDVGGRVEVYDTLDHAISGFGQQQSGDASLTFTSQHGVVRIDRLPRIDQKQAPVEPAAVTQSPKENVLAYQEDVSLRSAGSGDESSILALIEQLSQLKEKGILTEEEFAAKKGELLKRL